MPEMLPVSTAAAAPAVAVIAPAVHAAMVAVAMLDFQARESTIVTIPPTEYTTMTQTYGIAVDENIREPDGAVQSAKRTVFQG
ncbi:hypothetical protein Dac01nite_05100 [Demequina activiva]|uniref:Uncharacterized protein n=1 Tax=Demequina activiva TaxID=1582364 RepID=A0A919UKJ1_9MICO|nr:hypothetical protein Dac01nite_05100 [Demequina activiva]